MNKSEGMFIGLRSCPDEKALSTTSNGMNAQC